MERVLLIRLETVEPEAFEDTLKELRRTSTYGHRTQRTIEKTRAALKELQSGRKSAYEKAQQEAILLTQLAHLKGEPPDQSKEFPSPELCGGFVYSLVEVARLIGRAARLEEAKARSLRRTGFLAGPASFPRNSVPAVRTASLARKAYGAHGPPIFLN